jgi:hypothetical protein
MGLNKKDLPMPRKTVPKTKTKTGASARGKVVVSRKRNSGSLMETFLSRRGMFMVVIAFVIVGAVTLAWAKAATTTSSMWSDSAIPKTITDSDTQSVELGMRFSSKYAGDVTGVKFYKGAQNTGTHVGNLWSTDGKKLASVTFKDETSSGWQTAMFARPVSIAANTTYIISYFAPKGHYSVNERYFSQAYTSGPLTTPKSTSARGNGVYTYGSSSSFPRATYRASNYWVDVLFSNSSFIP